VLPTGALLADLVTWRSLVDTSDMLDAVIVGGGLAGLSAAWDLRDRDVMVLEAADRVGGRLRSERRGDNWLNWGGHVFSGAGSVTDRFLRESGTAAQQVTGRLASVSLNGKLITSGGVETFPFRLPMSLGARANLVKVGLKLRYAVRQYGKVARPIPGEDPAVRQTRIMGFMDDRSFIDWAGPMPEDVDLLFRATTTRSSGEPEEMAAGYGIGYFHQVWNRSEGLSRNILGGSATFTNNLAAGLGDRVHLNAPVSLVAQDNDGVTVRWTENGTEHEVRARHAIVATQAHVTRKIVAGLPDDMTAAMDFIRYGPYIVGAFETSETGPMPWDPLYALATPKKIFSMMFNIANVRRGGETSRAPGGSLMAYTAADSARALADVPDAEVAARYREDLASIYPASRDVVKDVVIHRWSHGTCYPRVGRSRIQPALVQPLGRIHLAGDYLGTWYTETATSTGAAAAKRVRERL
jgi:oxygen-dependent protoporphyrinogen oxidase